MEETPKHLYHGTSTRRLRAILKHGLKPRGKAKSVWVDNPSRPEHVYLTLAYAIHFAKCATDDDGGDAAIIRLDVDKIDTAKLYADEDALEQANRENDKARWPTMEERTAWYRDSWHTLPIAKMWRDSLGYLGNCSHHGAIPLKAISGVAIVERNSGLWHMSDPVIARINYRIMGGFYRALSAFPFEGHAAIERERGTTSAMYLDNLAKVDAGFTAYPSPLSVRRIISAAERKAA